VKPVDNKMIFILNILALLALALVGCRMLEPDKPQRVWHNGQWIDKPKE
jgi:hypothetical protein